MPGSPVAVQRPLFSVRGPPNRTGRARRGCQRVVEENLLAARPLPHSAPIPRKGASPQATPPTVAADDEEASGATGRALDRLLLRDQCGRLEDLSRRAALRPESGLKPDWPENRTHDLLRRLRNRSTVRTIKNYLQTATFFERNVWSIGRGSGFGPARRKRTSRLRIRKRPATQTFSEAADSGAEGRTRRRRCCFRRTAGHAVLWLVVGGRRRLSDLAHRWHEPGSPPLSARGSREFGNCRS